MRINIVRISLLFAFGIIGLECSCNSAKESSHNELWKGKYSIEIEEIFRIGTEDLEDDHYVFSAINDIQFDDLNNLYVLDRKEFRIQVYSGEGKYIKTVPLERGQGPGQFLRALLFDIDEENRIFIADDFQRRITGLDTNGHLIDTMALHSRPGSLVATIENTVFTTNIEATSDGNEIYKYHFPDGKILARFCKGSTETKIMKKVGGMGQICLSQYGQLYYASDLPNDIRIFTRNGELEAKFYRHVPSYSPPKSNELGLPQILVSTKAISSFPDGKLLHTIFDKTVKPYISYFDIYDQDGNWLLSFNTNQFLNDWEGRIAKLDNEGCLYVESWKPFPHIRKYSFRLIENRSMKFITTSTAAGPAEE